MKATRICGVRCSQALSPFNILQLLIVITIALQALAVSPKHQRKGLGSKLVSWGLEKTKEDGKDAYLLGTSMGRQLYLSLGFEDLAPGREFLDEPHYSMIKRLP